MDLENKIKSDTKLDLKSIAIFTALGFYLGNDSYFLEAKNFYQKNSTNLINEIVSYPWNYSPKHRPLHQVVDEFAETLYQVSTEVLDKEIIILPLSGGLDSRTQATLLLGHDGVHSYSYSFENGVDENFYGKEISKICNFDFKEYVIPNGYLWDSIDILADWNNCESEFTHPRQMAIESEFPNMGDIFYLGHWGDVLFDSMGIEENATEEELVLHLKKKIIKKGGLELAEELWKAWHLPGRFEDYLQDQLSFYLSKIDIVHAGAKIRAFKSLHWLPRWTITNLCVFEKHHPMVLPYCDTRMFDFVCTVPEEYLSGRKIQIEYIKRKAPDLAKVPWQPYTPQNLYNYHEFYSARYLPRRAWGKIKRTIKNQISGRKLIERNWEIQFFGEENDNKLKEKLFDNPKLTEWVPQNIIKTCYEKFRFEDSVYYSHAVSMLLTLSVFSKKYL